MAAPPNKTLKDLNGKWTMNKTLSQDPVAVLKLQGVGMIMRNTIGYATVTLSITQFKNDKGEDQINVENTLTGGVQGTKEERFLTWEEHSHKDFLFGDVLGRNKWIQLDGIPEGFGKEDEAHLTAGFEPADEYIYSWAKNEKAGWVATQVWGFQIIDGVRYHVRTLAVHNDSQKIMGKLVYDFVSE